MGGGEKIKGSFPLSPFDFDTALQLLGTETKGRGRLAGRHHGLDDVAQKSVLNSPQSGRRGFLPKKAPWKDPPRALSSLGLFFKKKWS